MQKQQIFPNPLILKTQKETEEDFKEWKEHYYSVLQQGYNIFVNSFGYEIDYDYFVYLCFKSTKTEYDGQLRRYRRILV